MMMYRMSCFGAGSMSKYENRRLGKPEFCDDDVYNVMLQCWEYEYDNRRLGKREFCDDDV